jgi:putative polyhydroxyalkanoate system protein
MADIELTRKHGLGLAAARTAAEKMSDQLSKKFGLQGRWAGDTLHFERPGVTGSLAITEKNVDLTVTLVGFLMKAMKGSIERAVNEELDKLFAMPAAKDAEAAPPKAKKAPAPKKKGA